MVKKKKFIETEEDRELKRISKEFIRIINPHSPYTDEQIEEIKRRVESNRNHINRWTEVLPL